MINAIEINNMSMDNTKGNWTNMLGDTGAQGHVTPPNATHEKSNILGTVNMANGAKAKIYQCDNTKIEDENGTILQLTNRRVIEGLCTPILSLTQLMNEGWDMQSKHVNQNKVIHMSKNGKCLTFIEQKKNLFYLKARVVEEILIANYTTDNITRSVDTAIISDDEDSDDEDTNLLAKSTNDTTENSGAPKKTPPGNPTYATIVKRNIGTIPKVSFELQTLNINDAHHKWGHHGEERLRGMAKAKGYRLVGKIKDCDACGAIKAKATPIPHVTDPKKKATDIGERLFVDITGPFPLTATKWHKSISNKLFWYGISDQYSGKMLTSFQYTKSDLVKLVDETFTYFKGRNKKVQYLRMDNAGENIAVEQLCKANGTVVEYVPSDTPKLNNMVERGFAIRWEIAKTLMQNAGLKDNVKRNTKILVEAIKAACFLNDECVQKSKTESVNHIFFGVKGKDRVKPKHFIEWGRIGFVANKRTKTTKMNNNGTAMLMVGYALNHPSGTYRFYNPETNSIIISNSVKWSVFNPWESTAVGEAMNRVKDADIKQEDPLVPAVNDISAETELIDIVPQTNEDNMVTNLLPTPSTPPKQPERRITRRMANEDNATKTLVYKEYNKATGQTLKVTGDTEATPIQMPTSDAESGGISDNDDDDSTINHIWLNTIGVQTKNGGIDEIMEFYIMHACIQSDPGEPTSWKDALSGPEREWWIKAIRAEFNNFLARGGWKFVPLDVVRKSGRRLVPTKLVFKKKDEIDESIRFKARCVTLGFMMVPGVDFTERFSPVATDESLKVQVGINLKNYHIGWETHSCDIEAAFLEPTMDNVMYIEPHPAMVECGFMTEEQRKELAILLKNSMYGNVDAAVKFFKVLTRWMVDKMGMTQSLADPCVFYKLDEEKKLKIYVSVTVDDCAVTGLSKDIEEFMKGLEGRFKITRGGILKKHLGVSYEWGVNDNGQAYCKATMEKKINALVADYEAFIGKPVKTYDTPGKPHEYLAKSDEEHQPENIDKYRSLVGQAMFITTKLCPKTGTATRSLSGFMANPNEMHWVALGRLIGYFKNMELKGILYVEPESFRLACLADTDYGNCPETRRSVGCSIFTMGCMLVGWHMSKHLTMSDSSCEAEYKELAKCAKGMKFLQMLLGELRLAELPGLMFEDNAGAIFLAGNKQVSKRTKHIDLKHHLIREFTENINGVQQGKIYKIATELNTADIGTKNVEVHLFKKHANELDSGMPMLRERIYGKNGILS